MDGDYEGEWHKDGIPDRAEISLEVLETMTEDSARLQDENERLLTALEQIRDLQPTEPDRHALYNTDYTYYVNLGMWEAAQIADAALAPLPEHSPMPGEGDTEA